MSEVWDSFWRGAQIGEHYGDMSRNARAYRDGGLGAVEDQAFRTGDLQTGMATRRFQDERLQNAYQNLERIRPLALGALDRVSQIAPEQRAQFLNAPHIRQRFLDWGIAPEQYDQAVARLSDPAQADAALKEFRSAFTQHEDPNWQLVQTDQGQQAAAIDPGTGHITMGDNALPSATGRMATPDEVTQLGFQPGTAVWLAPGQPPRPLQNPHYAPAGRAYSSQLPEGFVLDDGQ